MLNKHNLNIAAICPKDPSKYSIAGINVTETRTEATDGHMLLVVDRPKLDIQDYPVIDGFTATAQHNSFILDAKSALDISKAIPKKSTLPILQNAVIGEQTNTNGNAYIAVTDPDRPQVFSPRKLDVNFPKLDDYIPKLEDAVFRISFNAELLAKLSKLMADISTDKQGHVITLSFTDNTHAVRIDCDNVDTGQHAIGVLMPIRLAE